MQGRASLSHLEATAATRLSPAGRHSEAKRDLAFTKYYALPECLRGTAGQEVVSTSFSRTSCPYVPTTPHVSNSALPTQRARSCERYFRAAPARTSVSRLNEARGPEPAERDCSRVGRG